jgi:hypothetical protein
MKDKCNYYNNKSSKNISRQNTLEPKYWLASLFARAAKADISARGTKRVEFNLYLLNPLYISTKPTTLQPQLHLGFPKQFLPLKFENQTPVCISHFLQLY